MRLDQTLHVKRRLAYGQLGSLESPFITAFEGLSVFFSLSCTVGGICSRSLASPSLFICILGNFFSRDEAFLCVYMLVLAINGLRYRCFMYEEVFRIINTAFTQFHKFQCLPFSKTIQVYTSFWKIDDTPCSFRTSGQSSQLIPEVWGDSIYICKRTVTAGSVSTSRFDHARVSLALPPVSGRGNLDYALSSGSLCQCTSQSGHEMEPNPRVLNSEAETVVYTLFGGEAQARLWHDATRYKTKRSGRGAFIPIDRKIKHRFYL
ncbi:hypothetical protein F4803DRAFT_211960 [Xylaria telfairii]|nr:hypothetical protein F4803DRAFT_211960 [Xylaria telfairii]